MHRWVRGDWQNTPWLFLRGRGLALIDRFRLFDSVRRSLMPPALFLCFALVSFIPSRALYNAAIVAFISLAVHLFMAAVESLFHRRGEKCRRLSYVPDAAQSAYLQLFVRLVVLPYEAYVCLSAAVTALWRMTVSRRRLLEWATASSVSSQKSGAARYASAMWFSLLLGLSAVVFAPGALGKASAIIWVMSPFFGVQLSRETAPNKQLSPAERDYLVGHSTKMWGYFSELCSAREHFLPPDNRQERPPAGIAHRTSPTNIGLCLLCCLAATDIKIASQTEAFGIAENILATLRRLEKWRGHLYNWYDTRTLKPLRPMSVSTVDSGNLAVCLIILREGLLEYGQAKLAAQCDELLAPMCFTPLYNPEKRLLAVSYDIEKNCLSENCYDLFASEARSASFLAISRGDVPLKHWRALSRAQVQCGGYRGMVSWTGSMFEYMMPALFFTSQNGSLLHESERLCIAAQKKRTAAQKQPWGISEGGFYALDRLLNYRYAPHGCGCLALHRGMDDETVISPYSSYLALKICPETAVKNLMALEKFGCGCRYGHWEAVDFTSGRAGTAKGEVVRCVMAHHLGMSLVAACNALCGEIMTKRLMRDAASCAYACLLDERLPLCSGVLKRRDSPVKEKAVRAFPIYWERRDTHTDFFAPVCDLLSNGIYNVMLTDSGASRAMCGETCVYIPQKSASDIRHGIDLYLLQPDRCLPLLPSADMPKEASSTWQFSLSGAKFDTMRDSVRSQVICFVSENCCGEKRIVSVSSDDASQSSAELLVTLEPLLAPYDDYVNHPAFCRLGMHSKQLGDALIIRRLPRGGRSAIFLCVACSDMAVFSARRDLVPGRGGLAQAAREFVPSSLGWLRDSFICAKFPIKLCPDCSHPAEIAVAVGETEADAYFAAQQILTEKHGAAEFLAGQAAALGMTDRQLDLAMETLCAVEYPEPKIYNQHSLWRFGISGDKPVVSCQVTEENLGEAESAAKAHAFLSSAGVHYDLVFITDEGGGYLRPVGSAIGKLTEKYGFSGVLTVDASDDPAAVLTSSAKQRGRGIDDKKLRVPPLPETDSPVQAHPVYEWDDDNTFSIYVNQSLPPRVWSNSLTNGRFGYLATDCGSGHMWYGNAREYQLTPWNGDPLAVSGETLELNGESLFARPDGACCKVSFGYGFASWEKPINYDYVNLRAYISADTDARVFIVTGDTDQIVNIRWFSELVLGAVGSPQTGVSISREENLFRVSREESPCPEHPLIICSNAEISGYTASRNSWLTGQYDNELSSGEALGIEFKAQLPFVLVCGCDAPEKLSALCKPETALEALRAARSVWRAAIGKIKIETPLPALDRLVNGWLPYQALACRMMGRCSVYQCGGAVGFRDQLQDAVNLMLLDTAFARTQILQSCARQYFAGDVMHWWHETEKGVYGVRTRCSDDLLWLVWAVCDYIEATGDTAFLGENAPFLVSEPLGSDERDRYETALISAESASVLIHCKRAVNAVLARGPGSHGLLKIGTGDWNDGYDAVGANGQGESVWLTWFFCHTAERFSSLCSTVSDPDAAKYAEAAKAFSRAANEAWDNDHFLRGYFDDGTPLGSESQPCCKIDSTSQSFAALCSWADPEKTDLALTAAAARLYDCENFLVKLLDPPFENARPRPGYIESYGPGFRENGGQYTHGAVFLINALLQKGRSDEAVKLIEAILPEERCGKVYCAEPYVIAADVSSNSDCPGQAGWSWYTGSAGWLFRVVVQELLGIKLRWGEIVCEPRLPSSWKCCSATMKLKNGTTEKIDLASGLPPKILPQNETDA
ncbi:MAG: hypothetical protein EOM14_03720 [Clostridia bacterium]|nr:hypothetical protein [Clostridia bacterium]